MTSEHLLSRILTCEISGKMCTCTLGGNKGSLFDLVRQREETGLPTPDRNAVDELLVPRDRSRQTRGHQIRSHVTKN